jgi:glycerol-3-phosphate acyltransferase PlsY
VTVLAAVLGYLIGSISPARLVGHRLHGCAISWGDSEDPLLTNGDMSYTGVSGTAVFERFGLKWGGLVAVLDGFKALIPTLVANMLFDDQSIALAVAAGVVAGHIWPVYHRFHGGRGQACTVGAMLAIDPLGIFVMVLAGIVIGLAVFTSVDLARNLYPALALPWFLLADGSGPTVWFGLAVSLVTFIAMAPDIRSDSRARRETGFAHLPWSRRAPVAWREMFDRRTA